MSSNKFSFFTNLRPGTVETFEEVNYSSNAWLLSSHRLNTQTLRLAKELRAKNAYLMADNGTKDLIDDVLSKFKDAHAPLKSKIKQFRRSLPDSRRIPAPRELPAALKQEVSSAAHEVMDEIDKVMQAQDSELLLNTQLSMQPTHLIAREDFAIGCLIALGYERELSLWPVSYFDRRNRKTLKYWQEVDNDERCADLHVYATLGAMDYNTAYSAARLAAKEGVKNVAIGFAGINYDSSFCESYLQGRRKNLLGNAPRKYIRIANILKGIRDGYQKEGKELQRFHALGMGSRAQHPLLALLLPKATEISVDATSPIFDSVNNLSFYDHHSYGKRVSCEKIAGQITQGKDWRFESPFNLNALEKFGHYPDKAREEWLNLDSPKICRDMLHPEHSFGSKIAVFATAKGGITGDQAKSRTGHNHWVIDQLLKNVPLENREKWALGQVDQLIDNHQRIIRWGLQGAKEIL